MTSSRDSDSASRHRFFHAMVLMGGSLALRCGGEAATSDGGSGAGGAATGGAPTAAGGGASTSGGNASTSGGNTSGGSTSGGGGNIILPATGGQATFDPSSSDCPPQQWNCASNPPVCSGSGFRLPEKCACDTSRPLDASACGAGQSFVCLEATYSSSGQQFSERVPFACACVENQLNCGLACDAIFPTSGNCTQKDYTDTGLREILCACAIIVLR